MKRKVSFCFAEKKKYFSPNKRTLIIEDFRSIFLAAQFFPEREGGKEHGTEFKNKIAQDAANEICDNVINITGTADKVLYGFDAECDKKRDSGCLEKVQLSVKHNREEKSQWDKHHNVQHILHNGVAQSGDRD